MNLAEIVPETVQTELITIIRGDLGGMEEKLTQLLEPYKDALEAHKASYKELAAYLTARVKRSRPQVGMRVQVSSGDGKTDLGQGTYEGEVPVYFIQLPDGSLQSLANAEEEPPAASIPEGGKVLKADRNPKIRLDSGRVVYGCQVWWQPLPATQPSAR